MWIKSLMLGLALAAALWALPGRAEDAGTRPAGKDAAKPTKKDAPKTHPEPLPPLYPPLGRIGDVVQPPPTSGTPGTELVVTARFPGCDRDQALFLSRFVLMGAAMSGEQVLQWLAAQPAIRKKLYGKIRSDPLAEAIKKARASTPFEGIACEVKTKPEWKVTHLELAHEGRITAREAPPGICKLERGPPGQGGVWLFTRANKGKVKKRDFGAAVAVAPAPEGAKDACRPRLSAALFDNQGKTRLLYHADYGGALEVQVPGNRCQTLFFRFDSAAQQFKPELGRDPSCDDGAAANKSTDTSTGAAKRPAAPAQ